jgi:quinol monooxygenase YgiN
MQTWLRALVLGLVLMALGDAHAQTPAPPIPPPIEGNIYSVTYVEVMPTAKAEAVGLLRRYREAARKEGGNLRCEVAQRIDQQPHQFVILEIWKDQKAFEAHGKGPNLVETREKIAATRNAPTDERVHTGLSVGPIDVSSARDAIFVVTHVDVIPPRKDDGVAALKRLGDESRKRDGNLRFEVVQQTNRLNHFTVVEIWKDMKAVEAHSMEATAREFRDKLATMTGALYDERMYRAID